jgi:tetratricopeptide (TPR) repeat protein
MVSLKTPSLLVALICGPTLWAVANPELAKTRFQQGLAYERLGRLEEAYTELQLACNLEAANAQMALALGIVAGRLGRLEQSQRALEQSIAIDANSTASYYQLGLLYEKLGLTQRAADSWHRFRQLTQDPQLRDIAQKHINTLEGK